MVIRPGILNKVIAVKLIEDTLIASEKNSVTVRLSMSRLKARSCGLVASFV